MTGLLCSSFSYTPCACLDLASALGPVPVSPLDGATAIEHQKKHRDVARPQPLQQNMGFSQPWGLPPAPHNPFQVSPAGRTGVGWHCPTHITHPRSCARYLWSIITLPAAGTGLRGTERMRNPSPAIPGISVLGRTHPSSAWGRCWQSTAEGGGEGTDPGGDPVPCGSWAVSIHAGCGAGRPEEPRCHHSLL